MRIYSCVGALAILLSSFSAHSHEDVVVVFRGLHKKHGTPINGTFHEKDARSPTARDLSGNKNKRLFNLLRNLRDIPDTVNHEPSASLVHGFAQRFIGDYYGFRDDLYRPASKLYKALDKVGLDVSDHFFVSAALSIESAMRFAAGFLMGNSRDRLWPTGSGTTCIGWVDAFIIPQSEFMKLRPIVVNEGHALGNFHVRNDEFLRAQEVIFLGHIPKRFHTARLPLNFMTPGRTEDPKQSLVRQIRKQLPGLNKLVTDWMRSHNYHRVFGSSLFAHVGSVEQRLTDKNAHAIRGDILEALEDLYETFNLKPGQPCEISVDKHLLGSLSMIDAHAIALLARRGHPISLYVDGSDIEVDDIGLHWIIPLLQEPNVDYIEWTSQEGTYFVQYEDDEKERTSMIDLKAALKRRKAPLDLRLENHLYGPTFTEELQSAAGTSVSVEDNLTEEAEEEQWAIEEYYGKQGYLGSGDLTAKLLPGNKENPDMFLFAARGGGFQLVSVKDLGPEMQTLSLIHI